MNEIVVEQAEAAPDQEPVVEQKTPKHRHMTGKQRRVQERMRQSLPRVKPEIYGPRIQLHVQRRMAQEQQ